MEQHSVVRAFFGGGECTEGNTVSLEGPVEFRWVNGEWVGGRLSQAEGTVHATPARQAMSISQWPEQSLWATRPPPAPALEMGAASVRGVGMPRS